MKLSYSFKLRIDRPLKDKKCPIYIDAFVNKKRKTFSTGVYVLEKHWNVKKIEIKMGDPNHPHLNKILGILKNNIETIRTDCYSGKVISPDAFKDLVLGNRIYGSFYDFIDSKMKQRKAILKSATIKSNNSNIKKLKEFKSEILLSEIDYGFLKRYETFLFNEKKNGINTVGKSMKFIRTMIIEAENEGLYKAESPFGKGKYQIKGAKVDKTSLTQEELSNLWTVFNNSETNTKLIRTLRYFLFSCYTGLRYRDVESLRYSDIYKQNGVMFLKIIPIKTESNKHTYLELPLPKPAIKLIPENKFNNQLVFNAKTNQPTNRDLKEIAKVSGITKHLTFKVSRSTFANIAGELGMPIEVVQEMLNHSDIKTTLAYYREVSFEEKVKHMSLLDEFKEKSI